MAARLVTLLPRITAVVVVGVLATAAVTFAAGTKIAASPPSSSTTASTAPPTVVVPDVRRQAFVFAKGSLEDAGFAWRVVGSVHGFAANLVAAQSPAPGTRLIDTGAPTITLTLARNSHYVEEGQPEDRSSFAGTLVKYADVAPAAPKAKPATKPAAKPITAPKKTAPKAPPAAAAKTRIPAFVVPGAPKEPLNEMPLPNRARLLGAWLDAHPRPTPANVHHWLYQHAWIVEGARFGWSNGAEALEILVQDDAKVQARWGIGARSAAVARRALAEVEAESR